jgi:(1->4)-alpha-D-glucan 1-alpha-D-glucosylmutase
LNTELVKVSFSEEKLRTMILKKTRSIFIPSSTYRIQLNKNFTFNQASQIIPYLKEIGIEAVYCSPYFQSSPNSMHGYNVTDPNKINPELGSQEDYENFCQTLKNNQLGHIIDIVPNHMGIIGNNNHWWMDVLENGQSSLYANYFDIDWTPVKKELYGKVLLPVLGNFYGRVLENQEIQLSFNNGEFSIYYHEHRFPIDPGTYPVILEGNIEELEKQKDQNDLDYAEYTSIITALKNLPSCFQTDPEKMHERSREKEISKQRLATLVSRSQRIESFISQRLTFFNGDKTNPKSFDPLDELLNMQSYRLSFWSVAAQEINYRRFFDINELAAIRVEDENVFKH